MSRRNQSFSNYWGDPCKPQSLNHEPCPWLHILLQDAGLLTLERRLHVAELSLPLLMTVADYKTNVLLDNMLRDSGVQTPGHRAAIIARISEMKWIPHNLAWDPRAPKAGPC